MLDPIRVNLLLMFRNNPGYGMIDAMAIANSIANPTGFLWEGE
jgi:hypothetical protein